jgi:hypothetical protein
VTISFDPTTDSCLIPVVAPRFTGYPITRSRAKACDADDRDLELTSVSRTAPASTG